MPSLLNAGGPALRADGSTVLAGRWLAGETPPASPLRVPLRVRSAVAIRRPPVTVGHGFAPGEAVADVGQQAGEERAIVAVEEHLVLEAGRRCAPRRRRRHAPASPQATRCRTGS